LVGAVLALTGAAAAHWSSTRATGRLHGPQLASGAGLLLLTAAEAWTAPRPVAATTVAVGVLAGLALLALRSLPWSSYSAGALALLSWLGLVVEGLHRLEDSPGDAAWWSGIQGWPLLAAAGYAAALALLGGGAAKDPLSRGGRLWRPVAAGAALAELAVFVTGPLGDPTADLLIGAGVVAGLGVLALLPDPVWSRPAAVLAGAGGAVLTAELVLRPWASMGALPTGGGTPLTHPLPVTDGPAPWTALVVAGAVLLAAWCAAAPLPDGLTARVRSQLLPAVAPGAAGLAVATVVLTAGTPRWVAALAIAVVLAAACVAVVWQQGDDAVELAGAAAVVVLAAPALRLALASDLLTAALCAALAIAFLAGHRLLRSALLWSTGTTLLAALGVVSAAIAVAAGSRLADASAAQLALALAAWAVLSGLGARFVARDADGRMAVELTALLVGLAAVPLSPTFAAAATTATVVGSAVCLLAGLDRERDRFGWLGAAVLGLATLLRVAAEDSAPELATLPAAVVLLAAGVWRLRADPAVSSARALGSGLTLALLPSLLLALGDPVSLRGVLVGAAGVAVLAVGAARHWSAPFLAGAATTGVLAVRHLGPIAEALPRWVSLGTLGLALLLVGVTWEARRRDLTSAGRYVAGLR
ncbi:MAG TPA: hypothetical protein VFR99_06625, partial [Marmoricola sp.]|nr:hypothetical protein [Marmoricola sp.]